jgi:hypothetical protein
MRTQVTTTSQTIWFRFHDRWHDTQCKASLFAGLGLVGLIVATFGVLGRSEETVSPTFVSPSAQSFSEWLTSQPLSAKVGNSGQEFLSSFQAILTLPTDGRDRFLLPCATSRTKRPIPIVQSVFESAPQQAEFETRLKRLLGELESSIVSFEEAGNHEMVLRHRWLHAGLSTFLQNPTDKPWRRAESILSPKPDGKQPFNKHPVMGWKASSYESVRTPHFVIASRASKADTERVAELCEQILAVWQQIFFRYWNQPGKLPLNLDGDSTPRPFQVVLFANKRDYEESLKKKFPNIQLSTGYYKQDIGHSFFYMDTKKSYATLVHELTHQFFAESDPSQVVFDPDQSMGFWIAEGIALYMESMSFREMGPAVLVDVGGWDANRFQPARFHFLRNQTWIPCETLASLNGSAFRKPKDIQHRYSHAGGLAQYWMEDSSESRLQVIDHLKFLYTNAPQVNLTPWTDDELVKSYASYCRRGPSTVTEYLPHGNRRDLILSRCPIDSEWMLTKLGNHRSWNWLDLSFTKIDDNLFEDSKNPWNVVRLSVESTKITDKCLGKLALIPNLDELDLSDCEITDQGIKAFQGHHGIRVLWLTGTRITDASLSVISSLSKLESVHVDKTSITREAWERLLKGKPRLRNSSTGPF